MGGIGLVAVAFAACSGDSSPEVGASSPTFGEAAPDPTTDIEVVDSAVAMVETIDELSGPTRRCVQLRLEHQPDLATELASEEDGAPHRATALVADCRLAIGLADQFAGQLDGGADDEGARACLTEVFIGLSATERVAVTAVATGTGDEADLDAAAEMAAGVAACREGTR